MIEPNAFTIDVSPLIKPARKPRHLETRLRSKQVVSAKYESGYARYEAFLAARKHKLSMHTAHVHNAVASLKRQRTQSKEIKLSKIEETLQLANKNRLDRLAKAVAFHAKEVKRAKQIARSQLKKSIESSATLAKEIDTRLRISASRRERLQTIPRSRILDPQSWALQESLAVRDEAAMTIQTWWRLKKFAPISRVYKKLGLSRRKLQQMSFEQATARIQSSVLIKAASFLIIRAKRITGNKNKTWKNPARVLLSAYMLSLYPAETLVQKTAQEDVF